MKLTYPMLFSIALAATACPTDPGDVGSGSTSSQGSDDGASDPSSGTSQTSATGNDGSGSASTSAGESDGGSSDGGPTGSDGSTSGGSSSTASSDESSGGSSGDTGTMVADCSECGPDQGCVAEVAFMTEYFCVAIPDDCPDDELNCECGSELCVDPFTFCTELPDPPPRAIACECPTC